MIAKLIDDCFVLDSDRLPHDEALAILKSRVAPVVGVEDVPLDEAAGREHGRCASCRTLRVLTLEAEAAKAGKTAADWAVALADQNDKMRRRLAAHALKEMGLEAVYALANLTLALQDPDPWVRKWACLALGEIGPAASGSIPALTMALQDSQERVRKAVARALQKIQVKKSQAG